MTLADPGASFQAIMAAACPLVAGGLEHGNAFVRNCRRTLPYRGECWIDFYAPVVDWVVLMAERAPFCAESKRALHRLLALSEVTLSLMPENIARMRRAVRARILTLTEPLCVPPPDADTLDPKAIGQALLPHNGACWRTAGVRPCPPHADHPAGRAAPPPGERDGLGLRAPGGHARAGVHPHPVSAGRRRGRAVSGSRACGVWRLRRVPCGRPQDVQPDAGQDAVEGGPPTVARAPPPGAECGPRAVHHRRAAHSRPERAGSGPGGPFPTRLVFFFF